MIGAGASAFASPRVIAVIWTYNRFDVACRCVEAVMGQTRRPDEIFVVDSASPDRSGDRLRQRFPEVTVLVLDDNDGPGAAIAAAFEAAIGSHGYYWLVEDDSVPAPECLARSLELAASVRDLGLLGPVGFTLRRGQWYETPALHAGLTRSVDFVLLDGALVNAEAVERAGPPRVDLFIMMVDVEYALRLASLGFAMVQAGVPYDQGRLGWAAADSSWRHYYQTRNHFRVALDLRSPRLLGGFVLRSTKQLLHAVLHGNWASIRFRSRGFVDAVRRNMGRTVAPSSSGLDVDQQSGGIIT